MNYKEIHKERKERVIKLLDEAFMFYDKTKDENNQSALLSLKNSVMNGKFNIVVVGQFSAGKSTFLNALMGEKYLPSFSTETTATINFLRSVNENPTGKEMIRIVYADGTIKTEDNVSLENIEKFVSTKGDNVATRIKYVEVFLDSKYLNDGVSLIDSPGLNGILAGHEEITNDQIKKSHAAIFMFNAKQPGSKTDFDKLKMLMRNCKSLLIVLNQKDLVLKDEQSVESVIQSLKDNYAKVIGTSELPEIYAISSYQALVARSKKNLRYNDKTNRTPEENGMLLEESDIEIFENRLMKYLTEGEKTRNELLSPVEKVIATINSTKSTYSEEIDKLNNATDTNDIRVKIDALNEEYSEMQKNLDASRSDIGRKVGDILRQAERNIKSEVRELCTKYVDRISNQSDIEDLYSDCQTYVRRIESQYIDICSEAIAKFNNEYRDLICSEYSDMLFDIDGKIAEKSGDKTIALGKTDIDSSVFDIDIAGLEDFYRRRKELIDAKNKSLDRLDELELQIERNKDNERKRERLQEEKKWIEEAKIQGTEMLGPRPGVNRYEETIRRDREGFLGMITDVFIGRKKENVVKVDSSDREYYDRQRNEIDKRYKDEMSRLNSELNNIPFSSTAEIEAKKRQIERMQKGLDNQLADLEKEKNEKIAKDMKKQARKAKQYVEDLIRSIEDESLKEIYKRLRDEKDMLTNAALDVLQLKLGDAIIQKKQAAENLERTLKSSVEDKNKRVAELTEYITEIDALLQKASDCCADIKSIQIDTIKIA